MIAYKVEYFEDGKWVRAERVIFTKQYDPKLFAKVLAEETQRYAGKEIRVKRLHTPETDMDRCAFYISNK